MSKISFLCFEFNFKDFFVFVYDKQLLYRVELVHAFLSKYLFW